MLRNIVNPRFREKIVYVFCGENDQGNFYMVADMDNRVRELNMFDCLEIRKIKGPPRVVPRRGFGDDLPVGIAREECELEEDFADAYSEQDHLGMEKEAEQIAEGVRLRHRLRLPQAAEVVAAWGADHTTLNMPNGWCAVASENCGPSQAGSVVALNGDEIGTGQHGLRFLDGKAQRIGLIKTEGLDERQRALRGETGADPRILELRFLPSGVRGRTWRDVCETCSREAPPEGEAAGPVEGPQEAANCLTFLYKRNMCPTEWSEHWRQVVAAISKEHPDAEMHHSAAEMLDDAAMWDQVDLTNLAFVERAFRQMLLAEHNQNKLLEVKEAERSSGTGGVGSSFLKGVVLGNTVARGQTMLSPDFHKYLSEKLKTKADLQKSERKLREEMEAAAGRLKKK